MNAAGLHTKASKVLTKSKGFTAAFCFFLDLTGAKFNSSSSSSSLCVFSNSLSPCNFLKAREDILFFPIIFPQLLVWLGIHALNLVATPAVLAPRDCRAFSLRIQETSRISRNMLAKKFGFVVFLGSILIQVCCGWDIDSSRFNQFLHIKTKTPKAVQEQAVKDLITRLIPKYASKFDIIVNSSLGPHPDLDTFEYVTDSADGKLVISGTTGVAAALGFQHFLKYSCHAHVSWSGDQLKIPEPFPVVEKPVKVTSPNR